MKYMIALLILMVVVICVVCIVCHNINEAKMIDQLLSEYPEEADEHFYRMTEKIDSILNEYDIRYMVDYGSLLGAYREGRRIPWDNDVDITIDKRDWEKFIEATKTHKYPNVHFHKHFPIIDTGFYRYMKMNRGSKFDPVGLDINKSDGDLPSIVKKCYKMFRIPTPVFARTGDIFDKPLERSNYGPIKVPTPNERDTVERLTTLYGDFMTPRNSTEVVYP